MKMFIVLELTREYAQQIDATHSVFLQLWVAISLQSGGMHNYNNLPIRTLCAITMTRGIQPNQWMIHSSGGVRVVGSRLYTSEGGVLNRRSNY